MRIDGKLLAEDILEKLSHKVEILEKNSHSIPHLGVIVVGDDPATASYVRKKERMGKLIGAQVSVYKYPITITEKELLDSIEFLQTSGNLHGLIVQLPLPKQLNETTLTHAIHPDLDVDGFREDSQFNEPIARAVIEILKEIYQWETANAGQAGGASGRAPDNTERMTMSEYWREGQRATGPAEKDHFTSWLQSQNIVIMGKGKTGGQPILAIIKQYGITPTIVDSKTQNPGEITRSADILICAVGGRGTIIHEGDIKKDAILIGIGMSLGLDGKLHGDYDEEEIKDKAKYYTPIPGGVGPVNAAMLLVNTVQAAEK